MAFNDYMDPLYSAKAVVLQPAKIEICQHCKLHDELSSVVSTEMNDQKHGSSSSSEKQACTEIYCKSALKTK